MDAVDPTVIDTTPVSSAKDTVDAEYDAMPHGGSKTPGIIIGLAIALIVIFIIFMLMFFFVFNPPAMHEILVTNNCIEPIHALMGVVTSNSNVEFLPERLLNPGENYVYRATPGTSLLIQGYRNGDALVSSGVNPFTTVELTLAGQNFDGKHQVTDGNAVLTNIQTNSNPDDRYGVSVQGGYNIPITIFSFAFNNREPSNRFSCLGPNWNHTIAGTGGLSCPSELQSPSMDDYEVCLNPCTAIGTGGFCCTEPGACGISGGCQQSWPVFDYYTVFSSACPNCLITNCDMANYTCSSRDGLTSYAIVMCP